MSAGSSRPFASGSGEASGKQRIALMENLSHYRSDNLAEERVLKEQKNDDKASTSYEPSLEIETLKHTLSEHLKEKESLEQKITLLKNDFQKEESRNINKELALEKQVKELNNIVFKRNQSAQTKEESRNIDRELALEKQALGFKNPCYLKKAQQLKPKLYDGCVIEKSEAIMVLDTEETLMLAEESHFETRFVPQTESSAEQAFWSQYSVQTNEPNLFGTTIVEVPKELPKVSMRYIWSSQESAPTFAELFEINNLKAQAQAKDTVILKLKEKLNSLNGDVEERKVKRDVKEIDTLNIELDHKVTKLAAENEHLKQTYKQLYDSIKSSRVRSKEQCDDLINKVNLKSAKVSDLNASLQEKVLMITTLKVQLNKLKGKAVLTESVSLNPIDPELLKVDVAPLVLKLHKNRTTHT
nr:pyruvate, phosphate dikinase regulatory protein, chloroplastic [Tanacetum cinerariifolium]